MSYQLAERDPGGHGSPVVEEADGRGFDAVVGRSDALRAATELAGRIARRSSTTVLITGETGTGKELFARGVHYAGARPNAPFVAVNCPAIPATLLESELFGYERGAFTDARAKKQGLLEVAKDGTLFLDEVSSLPMDLQPKLLRALEERRVRRVGGFEEIEVRCRVVAATNEALEEAVAAGRFREDLFYRLNVLRLAIPPLRERRSDIPLLARHFADQVAQAQGLAAVSVAPAAVAALAAHPWPGNVRELKNVIERAVLLSDGGEIGPDHLHMHRRSWLPEPEPAGDPETPHRIEIPRGGRSLSSVEAEAIGHTLSLTGWNKSAAARILGISRPTLARKIGLYDLRPPADPADA